MKLFLSLQTGRALKVDLRGFLKDRRAIALLSLAFSPGSFLSAEKH